MIKRLTKAKGLPAVEAITPRYPLYHEVNSFNEFGNILMCVHRPLDVPGQLALKSALTNALLTLYTVYKQRMNEKYPTKKTDSDDIKFRKNDSIHALRQNYLRFRERIRSEQYENLREASRRGEYMAPKQTDDTSGGQETK